MPKRVQAIANAREPEIGSGCEIVEVDRIGRRLRRTHGVLQPVVQMDDGEYLMI